MRDHIVIKGAREDNLKNINVEIQRDALVVMTGLSGSGKSSLAFDTIFAEGQRRYMESLSSYARQFLGQMDKPDVDSIEGMSPAISIDQKTTSKNPRSTVGTVTEIYDYLRLLWARVGVPHCPKCGKEIRRQTVDQIVDQIVVLDGRVQSITFINGLKHEFRYATPAELPVCQKCGGRIGSTCGCRTRTFDFSGKRYQRIKVGDPRDTLHGKKNPVCPECFAHEGRWHHWNCKIETCPICGGRLAECEHGPNGKK